MAAAMGPLRYTGRVAVITGAGGGLGREYALLLAERGASVVVNDLGGSTSGEGKSSTAADNVVNEIRKKGGKAVPNYNSVEDGEKIIKTAIDNFGRIDILINNAGILRDKSFAKISLEDWDLIHRVHLRGSFLVTKAAWPYFRDQKYGRIIMTASGAGIYGNFGQANYSSAKLGMLGLSNTLAIEGQKYNIHCNTIIPIAASRLTQDILPPDIFDQLKPSTISPVVGWLCHQDCEDNGVVIEAAGGWVGKYQWQRASGKAFLPPSGLTVEAVRDNWGAITDMSNSSTPASLQEQLVSLVEELSGNPRPTTQKKSTEPDTYEYDQEKAILYALAVGMSIKEASSLRFLYEGSDEFQVLPTFGTIIAMPAIFGSAVLQEQIAQRNADPTRILHGEQYLELYRPLPPNATLHSCCRLVDTLDKGSGAVVIMEEETFSENQELVMKTQWSVFLVGGGNFGGKRTTDKGVATLSPPNRKPDAIIEEKTSVDQAALYRLCGDKNPMHIDPDFAAVGGFQSPILHGLCSMGYAMRHVLKQYTHYDVKPFKSIMVRFASPLVPGETLRTEMWKEGNRIHFQSKCVETQKMVLSGGYVDLKGGFKSAPAPSNPMNNNLKSKVIFRTMGQKLAEMPELAQKIQAVYQWDILQNGKTAATWTVDLKSGNGRIVEGVLEGVKPGCTLIIEDDDMLSLVTGKLDPQKAFMGGKLKIRGNIMLTQKLQPLLAAKGTPSKPKASVDVKCDKIFADLATRLKKDPELAATILTVYQWNILKNGKHVRTWALDLKNDAGSVYEGIPKADKPDCTFILEDDLFADIMRGKADPQKAFMSGKLKITGNVLASQKLQAIWENPGNEPESTSFAAEPTEPSPPSKPTSSSTNVSLGEMPATLKSDFVFQVFAERLGEEPELAKKMKVVYNWNILRSGKKISEWTVDLKTGSGSIYRGPPKSGKADVTLTMDDEDVILMMLGKLNPQRAFMTGRLKIKGNIMLTQKLNQLWQEILKSGRATELPILSAILADKPFDPSLRSEPCFVELGKRVSRLPQLVTKLNTVFEWNVTKNGKKETQWILDLKAEKGMLSRGPAKGKVKPTIFITVDDDIFADWILYKINSNNVMAAKTTQINGNSSLVKTLLDSLQMVSKL